MQKKYTTYLVVLMIGLITVCSIYQMFHTIRRFYYERTPKEFIAAYQSDIDVPSNALYRYRRIFRGAMHNGAPSSSEWSLSGAVSGLFESTSAFDTKAQPLPVYGGTTADKERPVAANRSGNNGLYLASVATTKSVGGGIAYDATSHLTNRSASSPEQLSATTFASVSMRPIPQSVHNIVSMSSVADGQLRAAPVRHVGVLPPPPVVDPDPEKELGYDAPLGEAILPLLILLLTYVCYRRKREQVMEEK